MLSDTIRRFGLWLVVTGTLIALPGPSSADFDSREVHPTLEGWLGASEAAEDQEELAESLHLEVTGDCPWDDLGYAKYAVFFAYGPEDEQTSEWDSQEYACAFAFSQDEVGSLGEAEVMASMSYFESWDDGDLTHAEMFGELSAHLKRNPINTPPEETAQVSVMASAEYELNFSLAQQKTMVLDVTLDSTSHSGSVTPAAVELGQFGVFLRAYLVKGAIPVKELILGFPDAQSTMHTDAVLELTPGDYKLELTAYTGNGEWFYIEGDYSAAGEFGLSLAECDWTGTDANDQHVGTPEDEILCALGGNDEIESGGGFDTIYLGDGDDMLNFGENPVTSITAFGGDGDDIIGGSEDHDLLYGEAGHDKITGRKGNDLIFGGDGDDEISGGEGDDEIHGQNGFDKIFGGDGDDLITGGDRKDVIHGDDGDDLIAGEDGDDVLYGDDGDDFITGDNGRDNIEGGRGKDDLLGGKANDRIDGGIGGDVIEGGQGHDTLYGGPNRDRIIGNSGNEILIDGGTGSDRIRSGPGDDYLDLVDGEEDFADCGAGTDDASDSDDIVDTLINCEITP